MGVAHAPLDALLGCDSGTDPKPAAEGAAGQCPPNSQTDNDMGVAYPPLSNHPREPSSANGLSVWGTLLPRFRSPTLFPSEVSNKGAAREGETGR